MQYKIISPLWVMLPRKKKPARKVSLNLNIYRNLHYQTSNQVKQIYRDMMQEQLNMRKFHKIELTFVLFKQSKRKIDRANVLCIVEKFICDAMVYCGCLEDDNDEFIERTIYETGGIDKEYPRVEVIINEIR